MPTQPDKAVDLFQQVRDQLSTGLDEMRSTVRGMRPFSQVNLIQSLRNLLEEVGRESGVQTSLTVEGSPSPLYPSQDLILYRNAQEALTNALKHGQPSEVKVVINYEPEVVVMSVMNDGLIPSQFDDHHLTTLKGLGVSGMKERCQLAGGSLTFNLTPQFTVISTLPIHKKN
jgi:signal transduction histidine kinase